MTKDGRLSIAIVTDNRTRAIRVFERIKRMEWERGAVMFDRNNMKLYAVHAVYTFLDSSRVDKYAGFFADQVIVDYIEENIVVAKMISAKSYIPEQYKLIDDRCILI